MSTLTEAVATLDTILRRGGNILDLFGGYTTSSDGSEFVLLVNEDIPSDDALGPIGGPTQVAFAEAPTLEDALVLLASRLAEAGYAVPAVSTS